MTPKKTTVNCATCGLPAVLEVVPDNFDDAPESFTLTTTCSGACPNRYVTMSAQEMHKTTRLPLSGWSRYGRGTPGPEANDSRRPGALTH